MASIRDFVLTWTQKASDVPQFGLFAQKWNGDMYLFANLFPPTNKESYVQDSMPRDLIIVLDKSGSMQGSSIRQLKKSLIELIDMIDEMRQQALNMGHLVDDLLLLSRLDGKEPVQNGAPQEVDINIMLDSLCAEARVLSGDKNQTILFHSHSNQTLTGSEKQLRSAFSNLVFNAVRYTQKDGRIDIYWKETDQHLVMSVSDNGQGIEAEHIPRLTERFYRVDSGRNRSQGGTGLGLAIAKHVLEVHNGYLDIQSTVGKGSEFSCYFPKPS